MDIIRDITRFVKTVSGKEDKDERKNENTPYYCRYGWCVFHCSEYGVEKQNSQQNRIREEES